MDKEEFEKEEGLGVSAEEEKAVVAEASAAEITEMEDTETPLDKNIKLMSPMRMVLRRFFRSKLSIAGIAMLAFLIVFSWLGPVVYDAWGETEVDRSGSNTYTVFEVENEEGPFVQLIVTHDSINALALPSSRHGRAGHGCLYPPDVRRQTVAHAELFGGHTDLVHRYRAGRHRRVLRRRGG